jgi:hypothetical protein
MDLLESRILPVMAIMLWFLVYSGRPAQAGRLVPIFLVL